MISFGGIRFHGDPTLAHNADFYSTAKICDHLVNLRVAHKQAVGHDQSLGF